MILKLGKLHWRLKLYKVFINGDTGLTMTYFTARSNMGDCAKCFKVMNWDKLQANDQINRKKYIFENNLTPGDCLLLSQGYLYKYVTIIFKKKISLEPLGQSKLTFMWSLHGKREHKLCKSSHNDMTKMAVTPI